MQARYRSIGPTWFNLEVGYDTVLPAGWISLTIWLITLTLNLIWQGEVEEDEEPVELHDFDDDPPAECDCEVCRAYREGRMDEFARLVAGDMISMDEEEEEEEDGSLTHRTIQ